MERLRGRTFAIQKRRTDGSVKEQRTYIARIFVSYCYESAINKQIFFNLGSPATKGAFFQVPVAQDAVEQTQHNARTSACHRGMPHSLDAELIHSEL